MKRIAQLLAALAAVTLGVMVFNALRVPSPAPAAESAHEAGVDSVAALARLAEAVRFRTVSMASGAPIDTAQFLAFHAFLQRSFPLVHATLKREVLGGLSLLYTWPAEGATEPPVVLMGHMDVVPVPEENRADWMHDPFSGDTADGFVWGRGTLDDKTTVLSILEAAELLLSQGKRPTRTVYLAFGHDEEVGGRFGARVIVDTLIARGVKPAMVLDEGGIVATGAIPGMPGRAAIVGIAEKGYLSLRLTSRAQGGHSSMPPSRTAVGALSAAIAKLQANPFSPSLEGPTEQMLSAMAPYAGFGQRLALANLWLTGPLVRRTLEGSPMGAALLRTTIAPTMLDAGIKDNVLPPEAEAIVNFRIRPGETLETVTARVVRIIADTMISVAPMDSATADPSQVSDTSSPEYQRLVALIRQMFPGEQVPVLPYLVMGGTDAKYWGPHSDRVFRFLPVPLGAGDVARIHGVNERVGMRDYLTSVGFFHSLLGN